MLTLRKTHGYLGQARVVEHKSLVLVYKIDKFVQSFLLSFLMLSNTRFNFFDLL